MWYLFREDHSDHQFILHNFETFQCVHWTSHLSELLAKACTSIDISWSSAEARIAAYRTDRPHENIYLVATFDEFPTLFDIQTNYPELLL